MNSTISDILTAAHDSKLVDEFLTAYVEAKRNYHLGGHRLSAVEGGRFCEAAYRILQETTTGTFTPLGESLDTELTERKLSHASKEKYKKSVRIYLPRALRVVYDIRNSRDAAHLADGIDPNLQDATLVVSILDWVVAEFVRLNARIGADEAQTLVERLVTRAVPAIQDFDGFPKVLRTGLQAGDYLLVLLYHRSPKPTTMAELRSWIPTSMAANLKRTLERLDSKALVHLDGQRTSITYSGQRHVEKKDLLESLQG